MIAIPILLVLSMGVMPVAYAQEQVTVAPTDPCFFQIVPDVPGTANPKTVEDARLMWDDCNAEEDFLEFALRPFQWVTGGYFSLIIVTILIIFTYVKYHNALYPVVIGTMFLPVSYFVFPDTFLSHALILVAIGLAAAITVGLVRLTKEYDG